MASRLSFLVLSALNLTILLTLYNSCSRFNDSPMFADGSGICYFLFEKRKNGYSLWGKLYPPKKFEKVTKLVKAKKESKGIKALSRSLL